MTIHPDKRQLDPTAGYKPLDFGADGITGSVDQFGRIIALNAYHAIHGYVTMTTAPPFVDEQRYHPDAVRAFRTGLAGLHGFGPAIAKDTSGVDAYLLQDTVPQIYCRFDDGTSITSTTFAYRDGAFQVFECTDVAPLWQGTLSVQRCAYTQLTEGGPLPSVSHRTTAEIVDDLLLLGNPDLPFWVAITGLPVEGLVIVEQPGGSVQVTAEGNAGRTVICYGFGTDMACVVKHAHTLTETNPDNILQNILDTWEQRWRDVPSDMSLRRALAYGSTLAIPDREGVSILTDHMLLPLSWNRDAYYVALALLEWHSDMADVVRRHLIWMFELVERVDGFWGRCYLANGFVKDRAFQLDQQLFPLLELADYVTYTNDTSLVDRLRTPIQTLIYRLLEQRAAPTWLFPTDETPADDPIAFPYHLSSHILMWRAFSQLQKLAPSLLSSEIATRVQEAIEHHFKVWHNDEYLYAYAIDGEGRHHLYHDANDVPLLLAPVWGLWSSFDPCWLATVRFAFSQDNKGGVYQGRLGSIHTPYPWPLGDLQEHIFAWLQQDKIMMQTIVNRLREIAQWDGSLPEAYDAETGAVQSRHWFAWPGALLAHLTLRGMYS